MSRSVDPPAVVARPGPARDLKTAAQPAGSTRLYEPALSIYLPLIAIFRYGAEGTATERAADQIRRLSGS